jgi:hypothetical protein
MEPGQEVVMVAPTDTGNRTTDQPTGFFVTRPAAFGVLAALAAALCALVYVFWPPRGVEPWLLIGLYALAIGVAGWSFAIGRRVGSAPIQWMSLTTAALLPLVPRLGFLGNMLARTQVSPDRPAGWLWVYVGDTAVTGLAVIGLILTAAAAAVTGVLAWRARGRPPVAQVPMRPDRISLMAALVVVSLGIWDMGWLVFPLAGFVAVATASIVIGVQSGRRRMAVWGWIAIAAVPVLHGVATMLPMGGEWAVTYAFDIVGAGITLVAGVVSLIGVVRHGRVREHR